MIPQHVLTDVLAAYLEALPIRQARRAIALILDRCGITAPELKAWGLGVPTEEGS